MLIPIEALTTGDCEKSNDQWQLLDQETANMYIADHYADHYALQISPFLLQS